MANTNNCRAVLGLALLGLVASAAGAAQNASCSAGVNATVLVLGKHHCKTSDPMFGFLDMTFSCQPDYELKAVGEVSLEPYSFVFTEKKSSFPVDICFGSGSACTPGSVSGSFKYNAAESTVETSVVLHYYGSETFEFLNGKFGVADLNCTHSAQPTAPTAPTPSTNHTAEPSTGAPSSNGSSSTPTMSAPPATRTANASSPDATPHPEPTASHSATMSASQSMAPIVPPIPSSPKEGAGATLVGLGGMVTRLATANSLVQFLAVCLHLSPSIVVMSLGLLLTLR